MTLSPERFRLFRAHLDAVKDHVRGMSAIAWNFDHDRDALAEELSRLSTHMRATAGALDRIGEQAARREQYAVDKRNVWHGGFAVDRDGNVSGHWPEGFAGEAAE